MTLAEIELRAKVTNVLLKHFGPARQALDQFNATTVGLVLDRFNMAADEIIKIIDEGRSND